MANSLRGEVSLMLDGEAVSLRPTFAAIMEIEHRLGGVVPLAARAAAGDFGLKDVSVIIWATWNAADGVERSLNEVGERVTAAGVAAVAPAVRELLVRILSGQGGDRLGETQAAPPAS